MEDEKTFAEMYEDSVAETTKGQLIKGNVVRVDKTDVFIDFGFKSEGLAPITDFFDKSGEPNVAVGDEVEVILEGTGSEDGLPKLSKSKADLQRENIRLQQLYDESACVEAKVTRTVKGGLIADVGQNVEIRAFIPFSQVDIRPGANLNEYVGRTVEAKIIKIEQNGIVLSRRALLEELRAEERDKTLSSLVEGSIIPGEVVKNIDRGVFVEIGGIEGFIPIGELSWGRVKHPSDVISEGDKIEVCVLKIHDDKKITLSLKSTLPDPWDTVVEKYKTGEKASGTAVSLTDFGVFVELEPGIEGLVHSSEISWTKNFRHPKEVVALGSEVEVLVLKVDPEKRRVSLSLRAITASPWETFRDETPPGTKLKGTITNVTSRGVFINVGDGIVGLLRPSELSWTERIDPVENFTKGDEIEVCVLNVNPDDQKVALGLKQLTDDPWKLVVDSYKPNRTIVTATVTDVTKAGVQVVLENSVDGFIRAAELSVERGKDLTLVYKKGEEIKALVIGLDRSKRQVNLSQNRHEQKVEREIISSFVSSQGDDNVTLGDIFGSKLKDLIKE